MRKFYQDQRDGAIIGDFNSHHRPKLPRFDPQTTSPQQRHKAVI
jgi:hypothetical protein